MKACDACRKKKIRCEPISQGCTQCSRQGVLCHFTPIATTRKRRRPAGFKYIAQLEERLSEAVGLLQDKTLKEPEHVYGESHLAEVVTSSSLGLNSSSLPNFSEKNWPTENVQIALVDDMINPWTPFGEESGVYSLDSLDRMPLPNVDRSLDLPLFPGDSSLNLRRPAFRQYQKMPTRTMAAELVHTTFTLYNRYVPLFDEEDFWTEFNLKFPISEFADPGWWACLNVVLSIAHRLRSLSTLDPTEHNNLASGYLQNALSVVTELSVSSHSLSAVQALTGMACILQGTADSEPAAMLTAASLRLAQAMNLHRECTNSSLTQAQAEIRRRVFWKTYILDKDISMRTGRPFSQDDEEMDVQLPSSTNREPWSMDGFRHRVGLAVIQGQVYKQLYSIRAEKQSQAERAKAAETLASLLSYWKSGADLEPEENSTELLGGQLEGDMLHKVVLRLTYLHCLSMIDRHLPPMATLPSNQMPEDTGQLVSSGNLYLTESREAFYLFKSIPHGDRSCVWMLLHAFFAAASKMLCNAANNPESPESQSDLKLVRPFLNLVETLSQEAKLGSRSEELREMHSTCTELNNRALQAVRRLEARLEEILI